MRNCWLVSRRITCLACDYPYSEALYANRNLWLKEQLRVLYFADPEFAGESLHIAEENMLDYIKAQERLFR